MSLRDEMYSAGNTVNDIVIFFFFWGGGGHGAWIAGLILVPWPEIEHRPSAVKVQSLNHWTAKEFPIL